MPQIVAFRSAKGAAFRRAKGDNQLTETLPGDASGKRERYNRRSTLGQAHMEDDHEIARRATDIQKRARDYRLVDLPGYMEWSRRKLAEGESKALIAHLDATGAWLLPEEAANMTESDFEELLAELKTELER